MKKIFSFLIMAVLHLGAIVAIFYAFWPIARWYLHSKPVWGVDFFLLSTLSSLLGGNLVWPFAFWNYAGFAGWPLVIYPTLHVYILHFLVPFFNYVLGSQLLMIVSTALFLLGAHFLFFILSGNLLLAAILAIFTAYSSGVYQTLTWAGSLPSYASQAAFPWTLFFLVWYLKTKNIRHLLASALIAGISIWSHPLVFVVYIVPAAFILIFTNFSKGLAIFNKLKTWVIFLIISLLIGLPIFYSTFSRASKSAVQPKALEKALSTTSAPANELEAGIANFNKAQVKRIVTDNNIGLFYILGFCAILFIVSLPVVRKKVLILESLPFLIMGAYFAFYIWLFGQGISIYHGGWYRLFWSVPIWVGALAAVLWGQATSNIANFLTWRLSKIVLFLGTNLLVLILAITFLRIFPAGLTIVQLVPRSQVSSAHPDILNLRTTEVQRNELRPLLIPKWLNGDDTNWRLYDPDQTVNLWWNSFFKMPLARGYLDPPLNDVQRGYLFWLDAALSESEGQPQLVKSFDYPQETATSNAQFLIDWNAIRYYEGGHAGNATSNGPVPKYLSSLVSREEQFDFNNLKYTDRLRTMHYFEFKQESTSPILSATNATTIGIFASDQGYETVIRALAERGNLNSQFVIPVKLGKFVDKYSLSALKNFDALYLYDYDYKKEEKTFKLLRDYLESGKKIFVETGVEVKQSQGDLPDIFPVKRLVRKGQGQSWDFDISQSVLTREVKFSDFSLPLFDEDEWKTSSAAVGDLKDGANLILKNHGRVVMASQKIGSGQLIWSGINFAYHLTRNHNQEEAKFFINILSDMVDLSKKPAGAYSVGFVNANNRIIETDGARGILFKEEMYPGWNAQVLQSAQGKANPLQIYKAGPSYPGFMYIPVGKEKTKVKLSFAGSLTNKILVTISFLLVIFISEEVAFKGLFLGRLRKFVVRRLSIRVGRWWEKEDEE